ncbi:MAG: hypothetical protein U1C70_07005 [Sediminibacterium sp.]|jgi:hypothetical protein|uniref:hypothetical protein n=1 Tax=Sediminibacterium sp. TaxID=1917865 RepID=UPI002ABAC885|nr:hypothetical protein [Sediminibacterium sp.]MDZ4071554.1 hypothetical protein [Sediminibacterium sp.]
MTDNNDMRLPDFVLPDLYKHHLVIVNEPSVYNKVEEKTVVSDTKEPEFLGNNQKKITILVSDKEAVFVNDQALQFLSAILTACKLNLGDVAIVNLANHPLSYPAIKEWLTPKYMILFDIEASLIRMPFKLPLYQVQLYDQCSLLFAPSFHTMMGDSREAKLEKSKLWLSLKNMFNL